MYHTDDLKADEITKTTDAGGYSVIWHGDNESHGADWTGCPRCARLQTGRTDSVHVDSVSAAAERCRVRMSAQYRQTGAT